MLRDPTLLSDRLHDLHADYVFKVNAAVAQDRLDRVTELTDAYLGDAQQVMSAAEPIPAPRRYR